MDNIFETGKVSAVVVQDAGKSACYHDGVVVLVEYREWSGLEQCIKGWTSCIWIRRDRNRSMRQWSRNKAPCFEAVQRVDLKLSCWMDVTPRILVGEDYNGTCDTEPSCW